MLVLEPWWPVNSSQWAYSAKCQRQCKKMWKCKATFSVLVMKREDWVWKETTMRWDTAKISRTHVEPGRFALHWAPIVLNASSEAPCCKCNTFTDSVSRFAEPPSGHPQGHSSCISVICEERSSKDAEHWGLGVCSYVLRGNFKTDCSHC